MKAAFQETIRVSPPPSPPPPSNTTTTTTTDTTTSSSSSSSSPPGVPMRMVPRMNWPHVVNLGNSIIGVSILTMPFCFQQCGIVLGTILLLFCTWLTLISCQLLMKAGITSRRKSFEFLAYHIMGGGGKFIVEFLLIGLQLGTMIAQIVVIGDLGPSIVSKFTGLENTSALRSGLISVLCLFVGLPLGLLKNVRSLSHTSTLCVCFYTVFVFYMILLSLPNLWRNDWISRVRYWRWDGFFQCIPIFSLAFGCQTQLFLLYDELPEPSFNVINKIVSSAVNICSVAYLLVGFFGYIAFSSIEITGDIINMLLPNFLTDMIKLSFVLSIAVTFPLIIFPCRNSLYTMLCPKRPKTSDSFESSHQIPEFHFRVITVGIIFVSMVIGISVPNVEFILGLNGATMGTLICYIMPALFFLRVMSAASEGKGLSKFVLVVGLLILITSTYTTLNSQDRSHHVEHLQEKRMKDSMAAKGAVMDILDNRDKESHRHEPPVPKPPDDIQAPDDSAAKAKAVAAAVAAVADSGGVHNNNNNNNNNAKPTDTAPQQHHQHHQHPPPHKQQQQQQLKREKGEDNNNNNDKEEEEKEEEEKKKEKKKEKEKEGAADKQQAELLLHKLEVQQVEQKKILEEQRALLNELKLHRQAEHKKLDENLVESAKVAGNMNNKLQQQQQQPVQQVPLQQQPLQQQQPVLQQQQQQVPLQQQPIQQQQQQVPLQQQPVQQQQQHVPLQQQQHQVPLQQQQVPVQQQPIQQQQQQVPLQQQQPIQQQQPVLHQQQQQQPVLQQQQQQVPLQPVHQQQQPVLQQQQAQLNQVPQQQQPVLQQQQQHQVPQQQQQQAQLNQVPQQHQQQQPVLQQQQQVPQQQPVQQQQQQQQQQQVPQQQQHQQQPLLQQQQHQQVPLQQQPVQQQQQQQQPILQQQQQQVQQQQQQVPHQQQPVLQQQQQAVHKDIAVPGRGQALNKDDSLLHLEALDITKHKPLPGRLADAAIAAQGK